MPLTEPKRWSSLRAAGDKETPRLQWVGSTSVHKELRRHSRNEPNPASCKDEKAGEAKETRLLV